MKDKGWSTIYITKKTGVRLFCRHYFHSKDAPNLIYIQTPLDSVDSFMAECYLPLAGYGLNVFALDLTGIGKSEGSAHTFSLEQYVEDLDACINFITKEYSDDIHLFGATGTGGIIGQYYAGATEKLTSFIQYGVGIYKDLSLLPYPSWLLKGMYLLLKGAAKWFPASKITFPIPEYTGYNAVNDNSFYEIALAENPGALAQPVSILKSVFDMLLAKNSVLSSGPNCPTLVFEVCHDRYFPRSYYQNYFKALHGVKKLYTIDDTHCSFYFRAEEVCYEAAQWVHKYSRMPVEERDAQI